jgi:hypothetical protein
MALLALTGPWPLIQFRNHFFTQTVGLLGRLISPSQGRYLYTGQHKHRTDAYTDIHALNGIRTHEPSVRASEDSGRIYSSETNPFVGYTRLQNYFKILEQVRRILGQNRTMNLWIADCFTVAYGYSVNAFVALFSYTNSICLFVCLSIYLSNPRLLRLASGF